MVFYCELYIIYCVYMFVVSVSAINKKQFLLLKCILVPVLITELVDTNVILNIIDSCQV
jgi:hypothetical protein